MTITGIRSKFKGNCPICRENYAVGDLVERVPNVEPTVRGHAECVANYRPGAVQSASTNNFQQPAAQQQQQAPAPRSITNGPGFALPDEAITGLWQLYEAMTMISQGAMAAAMAVNAVASAIDPYHAKANSKAKKDAAA